MNGTNEADDMNSPPTPGGLARLAGWCYDHRRRVLTGWILVVLVVIALSGVIGSAFSNNFNSAIRRRSGPKTSWRSVSRPRQATPRTW